MAIGTPARGWLTDPTRLAIGYLALPNLVFLVGWLQPWAAAVGIVALLCALRPTIKSEFAGGFATARTSFYAVLVVALVWTAFGGAGHLFYANNDWHVRDAVLRDLVAWEWPVGYRTPDGEAFLLRAPIGYFLPAALVGKLTSIAFADPALLAWTALGVWLFLTLVVEGNERPWQLAWAMVVIVLFSGMDVIGSVIYGDQMSVMLHLEWWARIWQYKSNTFLLFWSPNHTLPGWIAAAIIYRNWGRASATRIAPLLLALIPLWSPLTAIGVVPLVLVAGLLQLRKDRMKDLVDPISIVGVIVLTGLMAIYLTADIGKIPAELPLQVAKPLVTFFDAPLRIAEPYLAFFSAYAIFVALEFGLLFALIVTVDRSPVLLAAAGTLFLLPLYTFGPTNDFSMRASIPSLTVIAITSIHAIPRLLAMPHTHWRGVLVIGLLAVGSATPGLEFARVVVAPRWAPDLKANLYAVAGGAPPHYMARLNRPALTALLRPPGFRPAANDNP